MKELTRIEFNGQSIETKFFSNLEESRCEEIRRDFYRKPEMSKVSANLKKIKSGGVKITDITNYYYKDLMAKVRLHHSKWSLEELFSCNDLIRYVHGKTLENKKIFPDDMSDIKKIETSIRLSGKGSASKPTNFPIKVADDILGMYNINGVYYDYSCGWGVRLLSSLRNNIEYLGTDPNHLLVERLISMCCDYDKVNGTSSKIDIRPQGSEVLVEEWIGKVGVAFSSPPYFALEDYRVGEGQSYKEGVTSYEDWKSGYLTGTIQNVYKYLVKEGHMLININDYDKYSLVEDTKKICEDSGFEFVGTHSLKNIKRVKSAGGLHEGTEDILVFKKI